MAAKSFALNGNGKDVPNIGSMIIMSGLENPWDTAFLNDGTMFFTEKCKGLQIFGCEFLSQKKSPVK
mgnify:CR=1 FL=1